MDVASSRQLQPHPSIFPSVHFIDLTSVGNSSILLAVRVLVLCNSSITTNLFLYDPMPYLLTDASRQEMAPVPALTQMGDAFRAKVVDRNRLSLRNGASTRNSPSFGVPSLLLTTTNLASMPLTMKETSAVQNKMKLTLSTRRRVEKAVQARRMKIPKTI